MGILSRRGISSIVGLDDRAGQGRKFRARPDRETIGVFGGTSFALLDKPLLCSAFALLDRQGC